MAERSAGSPSPPEEGSCPRLDPESATQQPGKSKPGDRMSRFRRARAKQLRENATDAEHKLWCALEALPMEGSHFRRQVPIGPYVADFGCLAARLLIELDGGHHSREDIQARDAERQGWLEREGYRVLRFWNSEIKDNLPGVIETIYAALYGGTSAEPKRLVHQRRRRPAPLNLPLEGGGRRRRRREGVTPVQNQAAAVSPHPGSSAADPPPPGEGESRG